MNRVARLLGCTEGQAYTVVLGAALAALLLVGTVPAALRDLPVAVRRSNGEIALGRSTATVTPAPSTDVATAIKPSPLDAVMPGARGEPGPAVRRPTSSGSIATTGGAPPVPSGGTTPGSDPAPTPSAGSEPATVAPTSDPSATRTPLRVLEGGWATTGAGTPAARTGVPADSFPVAAGADGATSRRSFVRLTGDTTVLTLRLRTDAGANVNDASAALAACVITDPSWAPREAIALDQAPAFDAKRCAKGARQVDGSWRFDLGAFGDRAGAAGFTLVPDPARVSSPFQIVFDPNPGASS